MHRTVASSRRRLLVALLFHVVLTSPSVGGTGGDVGILRTHAPPPSRRNSMAPNWTSLQILKSLGSNRDPLASVVPAMTPPPVTTCDFEGPCPWQGAPESGFEVVAAGQTNLGGDPPETDADGNSEGHFLYVGWSKLEGRNRKESNYMIYSPEYDRTYDDKCRLKFQFHGFNISSGVLSIFSESSVTSSMHERDYFVPHDRWVSIQHFVGRRKTPFTLMLEVLADDAYPYHAAFDNIEMDSCFPREPSTINNNCTDQQFECEPEVCVDRSRVCDVKKDCPNGTDEKQQCDQYVSWNAYCTFKDDMCGWTSDSGDLEWKRREDHVYLAKSRSNVTIGHWGLLTSAPFPPPPRLHGVKTSPKFNSCQVRFFYRMPSKSKHQLVVRVKEFPNGNETEIWTHHAIIDDWQRQAVPIPALKNRYRVQFMGVISYQLKIHVELTNVSLSPDCFIMSGGNVTSRYVFSTCGARGRRGPTQRQCETVYLGNGPEVRVDDDGPLAGVQQWTVPKTGTYSVFATGASGGKGFNYPKGSFGAVARGVFRWTEGEVIHLLIGQEGGSAPKVLPTVEGSGISGLRKLSRQKNVTDGSGGGGGGATYVFQLQNETSVYIPLVVAAGGGGQCWNVSQCNVDSNAKGYDPDLLSVSGQSSPDGAGGGGGWKDITILDTAGRSLFEGALGGRPCKRMGKAADGGFGGGGGPCRSGGGGGGYAGGNAMTNENQSDNGFGGHSYVASDQYSFTGTGSSYGPGSVVIIPEFDGCGCDHSCVIIELETNSYICTCGENYTLSDDNATCHLVSAITDPEPFFMEIMVLVLLVTTVIVIGIAIVMFFLYQRYRRQTAQMVHQEYVGNPVLQLNRLRQTTSGMVTEYNPNYEFGGSTCTIQDLAEVPRENLTLVMALGQGAFGEVYQGYLSKVPGELGDVPVAIKTLPELSSSQAEMDFLMEALIMSKFSHPNIVKFIGVCFEKLPKFIVLELLPGGDLKSFLREARPKPDKPSPLTMKDLLMLAIDVAKGCHYLEENHFIHRDIAARNCLLTTKDVKRVVKIADFGMARDIYRADYYRKGGKAMLPVKWMPPEAFLDGIFTSKTDVWSFGVLLWEVMSLGYMPYPGRGNQDVMQLVTSGGRLEPPSNCPQPVYHIMSQCWHPVPEERPDFVTILERLGYCLQDQDVTEAPLPVFHRPPSTERDATVMRPADPDNICLQVQRDAEPQSPASTDYLIPIPSSSYSLCTEKTELQSASSMESVDRLLELDDKVGDLPSNVAGTVVSPLKPQAAASFRAPPGGSGGVKPPASWETSFMQSFAKCQPTTLSPTTWSGEYQSVPTQEEPSPTAFQFPARAPRSAAAAAIAAIPPPESSPARKSPPSAIARQRPSVKKTVELAPGSVTEARSAPLPLDPSTLTKQHQAQALPYANVAVADPARTSAVGTAAVRSEPYTITAPRGAKSRSDKDATC